MKCLLTHKYLHLSNFTFYYNDTRHMRTSVDALLEFLGVHDVSNLGDIHTVLKYVDNFDVCCYTPQREVEFDEVFLVSNFVI